MNASEPNVLLLSGAGLPAWIWDDLRAELGMNSLVGPCAVSPVASPIDVAKAALAAAPPGPLHLVAHSAGGMIAHTIARHAPDRIASILGVSAIVPKEGGSFLSSMPIPQRWALSLILRFVSTRPPKSAIRESLAAGLDEATVDRLIATYTPESQRYYRVWIRPRRWTGPTGYVVTTNDRELTPERQRHYLRNLGATTEFTLDTGHLPMLEQPGALAACFREFVGSQRSRPSALAPLMRHPSI